MAQVVLKPGRDKSVRRRHPWIFSGAVARVDGEPAAGATVKVVAADGRLLGRGAYSPLSQILVRLWSLDPVEAIDDAFWQRRLARCLARRQDLASRDDATAYRLVNGEGDGLPGLVVDRYGDFLVCQLLAAGPEAWRATIVDTLGALVPVAGIFERSDAGVRAKEGLAPRVGLLAGEEPPAWIPIVEGPCRFQVDVRSGHKTGFYLDQRDNRARVTALAAGREVLNAFAYTGAFGISALAGGATRVTNLETSAAALAQAAVHARDNGFAAERLESLEADVFVALRRFRDMGRFFDCIILDPPKFAESASQVPAASRGYKDINLLAMKLLRPDGLLVTFSCSGHVSPEIFEAIVAEAARDAGRDPQVLARLGQPADHPFTLHFPEGSYLKGLICRV
ncbi:MAG: class I SAM-dependent methyltransferase [Thermodesulfobacteriota bacterium]